MNKTIYFDMDGTIANFYGVENWLEYLTNESCYPYAVARPLLNFSYFARLLHKLQNMGYRIGIISWLSRKGSDEFMENITNAKLKWLATHLKSVEFDEIHIVRYGYPKENFSSGFDILFDDEENNRNNWKGTAYDVDNIIEILKEMVAQSTILFIGGGDV